MLFLHKNTAVFAQKLSTLLSDHRGVEKRFFRVWGIGGGGAKRGLSKWNQEIIIKMS